MKLTCAKLYIDNKDFAPVCKDGDTFTVKSDSRIKRFLWKNNFLFLNFKPQPGSVESRRTSWQTSSPHTPGAWWRSGTSLMMSTRSSTPSPSTAVWHAVHRSAHLSSNSCILLSILGKSRATSLANNEAEFDFENIRQICSLFKLWFMANFLLLLSTVLILSSPSPLNTKFAKETI